MSSARFFSLFPIIIFLTACSSLQQSHLRNFKAVLAPDEISAPSISQLENTEADLIAVIHGDRPLATMALAFIEQGQYKWISRDNVIFITQAGRIVSTHGLSRNLLYTSNLKSDPLRSGASLDGNNAWSREVDFDSNDFSLPVYSDTFSVNMDSLEILGHSFTTRRVDETVNIRQNDHVYTLNNSFWYDEKTGDLLRSTQQISHLNDPITITYLHRALRIAKGETN